MGTERTLEFKGPCLCGRGTFRIDDCEVDHSWPTSNPQWYECRVDCPICSERFSLEQRGDRFVLVERSVLRERAERRQFASERAEAIFSDQQVQSVLAQFEALLGGQPSVAATYRLMKGAGLEHCVEATFRRHWKGARTWMEHHKVPDVLPLVFRAVGASTERLDVMLGELHVAEAFAARPPAHYGEPIYVLGG